MRENTGRQWNRVGKIMQEQYEKFNKEIEAISNRNRNSKAEEYNERT